MEGKEEIEARLNKIAGQVTGIQRMLRTGRKSTELFAQIGAVRAALRKVARLLVRSEIGDQLAAAPNRARLEQTIDSLVEALDRLAST